jgi:hypothetical protein
MADPPVTLTREDADRRLAELDGVHRQVSTAMYAIDTHPTYELLRNTQFSGATKRVADRLKPAVEVLWAQFVMWRELLERAREVRGRRERPDAAELAELEILLCEPVVGLDAGGLPTAGSATAPETRLTVAELATRLRSACDSVTADLERVAEAQSTVAQQLETATTALAEARTLATDLGVTPDTGSGAGSSATSGTGSGAAADLERLAGQLRELDGQAVVDPLGTSTEKTTAEKVRHLVAAVTEARSSLAGLEQFREECPSRIAALRTAVDELSGLESRVDQAFQTATVKIAAAGLPPLKPAAGELRERLAQVERVAGEGRWTRTQEAVVGMERTVSAERARAEQLLEAATGLLDRRAELRGRLEAYHAKAARLGAVETAELSERYDEARALLWTSPCDLRAATAAVRRYQESVARSAAVTKEGR